MHSELIPAEEERELVPGVKISGAKRVLGYAVEVKLPSSKAVERKIGPGVTETKPFIGQETKYVWFAILYT